MSVKEMFERHDAEYGKFDRIEKQRTKRPDLHAFLLLDEIFPGDRDIISAAEHDEFFLEVDQDDIEKLTEAHVIELIRCGVMYSVEFDCLFMFA